MGGNTTGSASTWKPCRVSSRHAHHGLSAGAAGRARQSTAQVRWARLLWYDDPPACVVESRGEGRGARSAERAARLHPADDSSAGRLLLTLPVPERRALDQLLTAALADAALELHTCGGVVFGSGTPASTRTVCLWASCVWRCLTRMAGRCRLRWQPNRCWRWSAPSGRRWG